MDPRSSGAVLGLVGACTLLVLGLVAAVNLTIPGLAASELAPSAAQLLWIVDAYVVVFACLVVPGGAAGDRFGREGVLLSGLLLFAAGAGLSALAASVPLLLAARSLTGLGAALILPNCVGVLVHATPLERRGRALAAWATVSGLGGVVGNLGGGALLTAGSWRSLFGAVALLALACAGWAARTLPLSDRSPRSLDPAGTALFVAATVALLIGVIEGPAHGWTSPFVIAAFVLCLLLSLAWAFVELRSPAPLLDPRLFRIPALASASLGMLVVFFGSFGLFYVNASLLQYGRGYSVLQTGFAILPLAVPLLVTARFVPRLVHRAGIPTVLGAAVVLISVGLYGLSATTSAPYAMYAAWLVVIGLGFALALPSLTAELTTALPADRAGVAGGLQAATRELGSALGVAVVGTVLTSAFARHLPAVVRDHPPIPAHRRRSAAARPRPARRDH